MSVIMIMYTLYIGSNNITGVLEKEKAIEIIAKYFDGFSCYEIDGYWQGKAEKTLKVEIIDTMGLSVKITELAQELKKELTQDSILVTVSDIISNFI